MSIRATGTLPSTHAAQNPTPISQTFMAHSMVGNLFRQFQVGDMLVCMVETDVQKGREYQALTYRFQESFSS